MTDAHLVINACDWFDGPRADLPALGALIALAIVMLVLESRRHARRGRP